MKRHFVALTVLGACLMLTGCDEDQRNTEEKLSAPSPDYATRYTMACPKCGAPQKPFRISQLKSYYKCTGQPPKFPYHDEKQWSHRISDHDDYGNIER